MPLKSDLVFAVRATHASVPHSPSDRRYGCQDCGVNTHAIEEYYMLRDDVWRSTGIHQGKGMLCIGCVEDRLGRRLAKSDFKDCPLNFGSPTYSNPREKSMRLADRLSG